MSVNDRVLTFLLQSELQRSHHPDFSVKCSHHPDFPVTCLPAGNPSASQTASWHLGHFSGSSGSGILIHCNTGNYKEIGILVLSSTLKRQCNEMIIIFLNQPAKPSCFLITSQTRFSSLSAGLGIVFDSSSSNSALSGTAQSRDNKK